LYVGHEAYDDDSTPSVPHVPDVDVQSPKDGVDGMNLGPDRSFAGWN